MRIVVTDHQDSFKSVIFTMFSKPSHTTLSDIELAKRAQVAKSRFNNIFAEECLNSDGDIAKDGQNKIEDSKGNSIDDYRDDEEAQEEEASVNDEKTVDNFKGTVDEEEMSLTEKPRECETTELDDLNDVFLVMDDCRLAVSKVVLCLASPVFKSMVESSISHKQEIHLPGKKYSDVKEFYSCIDPRTVTPITDQNIYTVLPLIYEFKVECLLRRCQMLLPDKVTELMDPQELCRHLHLALHYSLFDLEVKCVNLCSELKLAEMVEWMSFYNIPDPVQLKVRDISLHRHELEESDMTIITQLYKHEKEVTNKDFPNLLCEELKQNHFSKALKKSSIKTPVSSPPCGTPIGFGKPATTAGSLFGGFGSSAFGSQSSTGGLFGAIVEKENDRKTTKSPRQVQPTASASCPTTVAADSGATGGFNFSKKTPENETYLLKFLQGMRLFYKYLADTHSDMKRDVVQYMRSQMNKLSTKEREIYDLLPARAKHDVRGRLVKEIPDKN